MFTWGLGAEKSQDGERGLQRKTNKQIIEIKYEINKQLQKRCKYNKSAIICVSFERERKCVCVQLYFVLQRIISSSGNCFYCCFLPGCRLAWLLKKRRCVENVVGNDKIITVIIITHGYIFSLLSLLVSGAATKVSPQGAAKGVILCKGLEINVFPLCIMRK